MVILAACVSLALTAQATPKILSICQLNEHGVEFNGQHVRVQSIYQTDNNHFSFFRDPACPHVIVDEDETREGGDGLARFNSAKWWHFPYVAAVF
jgi:hypothetical protein